MNGLSSVRRHGHGKRPAAPRCWCATSRAIWAVNEMKVRARYRFGIRTRGSLWPLHRARLRSFQGNTSSFLNGALDHDDAIKILSDVGAETGYPPFIESPKPDCCASLDGYAP